MNPLHALTTRGLSLAGNRNFGFDLPAGPLNLAADALVALPAETTIRGLSLARRTLLALLPANDNQRLGDCVDCGAPVTEGDPFIATAATTTTHTAVPKNPPALSRRGVRTSPAST